jgi:hypothetical protein
MFSLFVAATDAPDVSQSLSLPCAPPNTLDYEEEHCEEEHGDKSAWQPLATAIAFYALYTFAHEQEEEEKRAQEDATEEFVINEYGNWAERLIFRLSRLTGSKRKRDSK